MQTIAVPSGLPSDVRASMETYAAAQRTVTIPAELHAALVQYLTSRPLGEVVQLWNALVQAEIVPARIVETAPAPDIAPANDLRPGVSTGPET